MKKIIILFLIIITSAIPSFSHPHLFIDVEIELIISNHGIDGIHHKWKLLRSFSTNIIKKYDKNQNGTFDKREQNKIKKEVF